MAVYTTHNCGALNHAFSFPGGIGALSMLLVDESDLRVTTSMADPCYGSFASSPASFVFAMRTRSDIGGVAMGTVVLTRSRLALSSRGWSGAMQVIGDASNLFISHNLVISVASWRYWFFYMDGVLSNSTISTTDSVVIDGAVRKTTVMVYLGLLVNAAGLVDNSNDLLPQRRVPLSLSCSRYDSSCVAVRVSGGEIVDSLIMVTGMPWAPLVDVTLPLRSGTMAVERLWKTLRSWITATPRSSVDLPTDGLCGVAGNAPGVNTSSLLLRMSWNRWGALPAAMDYRPGTVALVSLSPTELHRSAVVTICGVLNVSHEPQADDRATPCWPSLLHVVVVRRSSRPGTAAPSVDRCVFLTADLTLASTCTNDQFRLLDVDASLFTNTIVAAHAASINSMSTAVAVAAVGESSVANCIFQFAGQSSIDIVRGGSLIRLPSPKLPGVTLFLQTLSLRGASSVASSSSPMTILPSRTPSGVNDPGVAGTVGLSRDVPLLRNVAWFVDRCRFWKDEITALLAVTDFLGHTAFSDGPSKSYLSRCNEFNGKPLSTTDAAAPLGIILPFASPVDCTQCSVDLDCNAALATGVHGSFPDCACQCDRGVLPHGLRFVRDRCNAVTMTRTMSASMSVSLTGTARTATYAATTSPTVRSTPSVPPRVTATPSRTSSSESDDAHVRPPAPLIGNTTTAPTISSTPAESPPPSPHPRVVSVSLSPDAAAGTLLSQVRDGSYRQSIVVTGTSAAVVSAFTSPLVPSSATKAGMSSALAGIVNCVISDEAMEPAPAQVGIVWSLGHGRYRRLLGPLLSTTLATFAATGVTIVIVAMAVRERSASLAPQKTAATRDADAPFTAAVPLPHRATGWIAKAPSHAGTAAVVLAAYFSPIAFGTCALVVVHAGASLAAGVGTSELTSVTVLQPL